eukprot:2869984-Rhodomonas_salina.1
MGVCDPWKRKNSFTAGSSATSSKMACGGKELEGGRAAEEEREKGRKVRQRREHGSCGKSLCQHAWEE